MRNRFPLIISICGIILNVPYFVFRGVTGGNIDLTVIYKFSGKHRLSDYA